MKPLLQEIESFLLGSTLAMRTKYRYRQHLIKFTEYISDLTDDSIDTVNLSKIYYTPYENNFIYNQIDAKIVDQYFEVNLSNGFSWLATTKSSISSLFKYLAGNYDFENVIYGIEFNLEDHRPEPKEKRTLNRQEILKLIMNIVKHSRNVERDCLLFVTLLSTGCRIDEILRLKPRDVHTDNNVFFLRSTKNKRSKYVVSKIGLTKIIQVFCSRNNVKPDEFIFSHGQKGKPISQNKVRELLHSYLRLANIPPARVHDLRRSFATIMYENGTDIDIIRQLLNHETINSTKIYIQDNYVRNETIQIPIYDSIFADLRNKRMP